MNYEELITSYQEAIRKSKSQYLKNDYTKKIRKLQKEAKKNEYKQTTR